MHSRSSFRVLNLGSIISKDVYFSVGSLGSYFSNGKSILQNISWADRRRIYSPTLSFRVIIKNNWINLRKYNYR